MQKKEFVNYKEFLEFAYKYKDKINSFKYYDGRLYSFRTNNFNCKYLLTNDVLTPNKFVKELGFENYNAFVNKKFSKLKDYAKNKTDYKKWYGGYKGGLIGVNYNIINDYVGSGEIFEFYDYDINKAYLYGLTQWLPTKFIKNISYEEYLKLNSIDKEIYIYFFEIEIEVLKSKYFNAIGKIKNIYSCFDFLNSKQHNKIIVSEARLSLINQIYFKTYNIKKVFVFERGKFNFYENILQRYIEIKDNYGSEFKKNALRLYGTLGQIISYKSTKLKFDKELNLVVNYKQDYNIKSSPHVAMWVADNVALKLFEIISSNMDKIICWNTDGLTSLKPLNLQISKKAGQWKLNHFEGIPFLFNEQGSRLFFKDIKKNCFYGATNIEEIDGKIFECLEFNFSNVKKGFVSQKKKFEIKKDLTFDKGKTFRELIFKDKMTNELLREYEEF